MLCVLMAPAFAVAGGGLTHSWFGSTSWPWIIGSGVVGVLVTLAVCGACRRLAKRLKL